MEDVLSITYVSAATTLWTEDELLQLLNSARARNTAAEITGMMLYRGGNIMQAIEGPDDAVEALFGRLWVDPRHHGIIVILRETITKRAFPNWSMGFRNISGTDLAEVQGYSDFLNPAFATLGDTTAPAHVLLDSFRDTMR